MNKSKDPLGPQRYHPFNPNHKQGYHHKPYDQSNIPDQTFSKAEREDLVKTKGDMPGPGKYEIEGDFDKAMKNPKFHMGKKPQGYSGKNLD